MGNKRNEKGRVSYQKKRERRRRSFCGNDGGGSREIVVQEREKLQRRTTKRREKREILELCNRGERRKKNVKKTAFQRKIVLGSIFVIFSG